MGCTSSTAASAQAAPAAPAEGTLLTYRKVEKAKVTNQEKRLLLVSDNLPSHKLLLEAALDNVVTIAVKFSEWSLDDLQKHLILLAGKPAHQFRTVGLLDHGKPGEFCLLKSIDGGTIDINDFVKHPEYMSFFKFLAEYVQQPLDASKWKNDPHARIDLLACHVYDGDAGKKLIDHLEENTHVNWTASADATGNAENGFNWVMESDSSVGEVHRDYFDLTRIKKWTFCADLMQIFIKTINGKTIAMDVEASDTVLSLKQKIQQTEEMSPEKQRLVYNGKMMEDGKMLSAYNVEKDTTIHLVPHFG